MADRSLTRRIAALGTLAVVAYAALAAVQILVLNPLAAVPGRTLPQIEAILTDLSLDFIGFINLDSTIITHYDAMFPDDPQRTNLSHWNEYELNNSDTFRSMYQFWLRKKSSQKVI